MPADGVGVGRIRTRPAPSSGGASLRGTSVVLTGATAGIGAVMADELARRGASLFLIARDRTRLETVLRLHRGQGADVDGAVCDLAEPAAVRSIAEAIRSTHPRLDVLINNAGALFYQFATNSAGDEKTFALNVLAPFLLMETLWPSLAASGAGRVVNLASTAHRTGTIDLADIDRRRHYRGWAAYSQSKLALLLLTREAPRRHPGSPVTVNACHPGFVRSHFGLEGRGWGPALMRFAQRIGAISPERGAATPLFLATDPSVARYTGEYFAKRSLARGSRRSLDPATARALWDLCEERAGRGARPPVTAGRSGSGSAGPSPAS